MSESERAVCRGGPEQYNGRVWPVAPGDYRLWFQPSDFGGPGGVYERRDVVEQLPDGPAVRFEYIASDIASLASPD